MASMVVTWWIVAVLSSVPVQDHVVHQSQDSIMGQTSYKIRTQLACINTRYDQQISMTGSQCNLHRYCQLGVIVRKLQIKGQICKKNGNTFMFLETETSLFSVLCILLLQISSIILNVYFN